MIVVGDRWSYGDLAVAGIFVDGLKVLDAFVQELPAVLAMRQESSFGNSHVREQVVFGEIMVPADGNRIYLSLLAFLDDIDNRRSGSISVHAAGDLGIKESLGLEV